MDKIRVAVFGISTPILQVIRNEIDPRKVELVTFIDNDKSKQGTCFMNIPVVSLEQIDKDAIDYFLVTALSAYEKIKQQLMEFGIHKERIQVFVTEQLCEYCLGSIEDIDLDFIQRVYFKPDKMTAVVARYHEIYSEYSKVPVYEEASEEWFQKSNLISHACGGIVNGRQVMYSNSKEAFQYSMEQGFKIIECDMLRLKKGELVLAHDYWRFYEAEEEQYSMLTARGLLAFLKEHPQVSCLVDVKWDNYDEYADYVNEIEKIIKDICKDKEESRILKEQIIMEVYDEPTIRIAKEKSFNMIFTQYRNPESACFMNTVNICYRYGIKAVAFSVCGCFKKEKFLKIVTDKNIKIYAFSSDSVEEYNSLRKLGVTGIFTNYLTEKTLI